MELKEFHLHRRWTRHGFGKGRFPFTRGWAARRGWSAAGRAGGRGLLMSWTCSKIGKITLAK